MKITKITVYRVALPFKPFGSRFQKSKPPKSIDSTIVEIQTDEGINGFGESCPIGAVYLPACAESARAGIEVLAPHLLGQDPQHTVCINDLMDASLKGHPHAKCALDIACWDILGKACGLPLYMLLGGRFTEDFPLYMSIPIGKPEEMVDHIKERRAQGYRRFQVKVGLEPEDDIERIRQTTSHIKKGEKVFVDSNCGWTPDDALRVVRGVRDCDFYLEQPCETYEACLRVSKKTDFPFFLDESMDDVPDLLRALADSAIDGIVIKLSHVGGLSKALTLKTICTSAGIRMRIEDTIGTDFARAAVTHLAHTVPPNFMLAAYACGIDKVCTAEGTPQVKEGRLGATTQPGLGLTPKFDVLQDPIAVYE